MATEIEVLTEEYLIPLKQRYPDSKVDCELDIEEIATRLLPQNSKHYEQMSRLIHSPRGTIPAFVEEQRMKREAEQQRIEEEAIERRRKERSDVIHRKFRAVKRITTMSNQLKGTVDRKNKSPTGGRRSSIRQLQRSNSGAATMLDMLGIDSNGAVVKTPPSPVRVTSSDNVEITII
jgi:hypothetical protein